MPPGAPAEIVGVYREAFLKVLDDPEFVARAKTMSDDFTPTYWQDLQSWIQTMADTPDESIKYISVMLRRQGVMLE